MHYFEDKSLSWKAKGLLTYLLNIKVKIDRKDLVKKSKDGYESMVTGLNELCEHGYLTPPFEIKDSEGKYMGYDYYVSETPKFKRNDDREA